MDAIFHEKQEGSLCAQHCLNALLQGPYFSAVDLADIARQLDESEREQMAEAGLDNEGYQHFLEQPSQNYDDSGFFSVQVIDKALHVMNLELVQYNAQKPICQQARADPTQMKSYICNFAEHWITVRKIGNQWFNLNSLLTGPELLSDTYLRMFLTQLQQDGYSIFIVVGEQTECEADQLLRLCPAIQPIKPQLITDKTKHAGSSSEQPDPAVEIALLESKKLVENDDVSLQRALQLSMEGYIEESLTRMDTVGMEDEPGGAQASGNSTAISQTSGGSSQGRNQGTPGATNGSQSSPGHTLGGDVNMSQAKSLKSGVTTGSEQPDANEMRQKRLAFLSKISDNANNENETSNSVIGDETQDGASGAEIQVTSKATASGVSELSEEEMLEQAIAMSMSQQET